MFVRVNNTKNNIIVYLMLVVVCFAFGFIYVALSSWINILGWIFVILTAGLFFFSGGNFVEQGAFNHTTWKIVFIFLIPVFIFVDYILIKNITWYTEYSGTAYYVLYTVGFLFKRIPSTYDTF